MRVHSALLLHASESALRQTKPRRSRRRPRVPSVPTPHVAVCLEKMRYRGIRHFNMVMLCFWVFFQGRYMSVCGFMKQWLGFAVCVLLYVLT